MNPVKALLKCPLLNSLEMSHLSLLLESAFFVSAITQRQPHLRSGAATRSSSNFGDAAVA